MFLHDQNKKILASSRLPQDTSRFLDALKNLISHHFEKALIVIDALDECQDTYGLLRDIFTVSVTGKLRLLATSRPSEDIKETFKNSLFLNIFAITEDLKSYVRTRLSEFKVLSDKNNELSDHIKTQLRDSITEKISRATNSIFLLAKFHVESLMAKTTPAQITRTLETLPRGPGAFQQAYNKTINRIRGQQREYQQLARRTLQWLTCAAREFTTLELRHALAINSDTITSPDESELESTNVMIEVCMGLVTVEKRSGVIRLLHHTTLEYLRQNTACLWSLEGPEDLRNLTSIPMDSENAIFKAHQEAVSVCITYLSFEAIRQLLTKKDWRSSSESNKYPLIKYAKKYWDHHWREAFNKVNPPDDMKRAMTEFLDNGSTAAIAQRSDADVDMIETMKPLHVASFFGLTDMIEICIERGCGINGTTSCGRTPIWFALQSGHERTVGRLLQNGATDSIVAYRADLRPIE